VITLRDFKIIRFISKSSYRTFAVKIKYERLHDYGTELNQKTIINKIIPRNVALKNVEKSQNNILKSDWLKLGVQRKLVFI